MTTTAEPPSRALDPRMRAAIVAVAGLGVVFAAVAGASWGLRVGISVAVGALIATANLYGLARIVGALVGTRAGGESDPALWGVLAVLKVLGLFGGVWLLLASHLVDPIPLVVGWGALPMGIAIGSIFSDKTDRQSSPRGKEAPPAGPPSP